MSRHLGPWIFFATARDEQRPIREVRQDCGSLSMPHRPCEPSKKTRVFGPRQAGVEAPMQEQRQDEYAPPICTGVRAHPKELGIQHTGLLRGILFYASEDVFVRTLKGIASVDGSLPTTAATTAAASNATTPRSKGALPAGIDTGISINVMSYQTISCQGGENGFESFARKYQTLCMACDM